MGSMHSHMFSWGIAVALTAIPLSSGDVQTNSDGSCWLKNGPVVSRALYGTLLFAFILLCTTFTIYSACKIRLSQQHSKQAVRNRMVGLVCVFISAFTLPLVHETMIIFRAKGSEWPIELQAASSMMVGGIGIFNLIVWIVSTLKRSRFGSLTPDGYESMTEGDEYDQVVVSRPLSAGAWSEGLLSSTMAAQRERGHLNSLSESRSSIKRPPGLSLSQARPGSLSSVDITSPTLRATSHPSSNSNLSLNSDGKSPRVVTSLPDSGPT